jgi:hypothetical protein
VTIRPEVRAVVDLGPFPDDDADVPYAHFVRIEAAVLALDASVHDGHAPLDREEAVALVGVLGRDTCFGMASTVLHAIETCPQPVVMTEPPDDGGMVRRLWDRYRRGVERGVVPPIEASDGGSGF